MTNREIVTNKHRARLSRLPANSGHARVLRAKLGITDEPVAPIEVKSEVSAPKPTLKSKLTGWSKKGK